MSPRKSPEEPPTQDIKNKDKVAVKNNEAEELLSVWTIIAKTRETDYGRKIDRYYKDPVTGRLFRSLKDVQRYLETGEVGRVTSKPKNNECVDAPPPSPPLPRRQRKTRHVKHVSNMEDDASLPPPKTRRAAQQTGIKIDPPPEPAARAKRVTLASQEENIKETEVDTDSKEIETARKQNGIETEADKDSKEIFTGPFATLPPTEDQAPPPLTVAPAVDSEKQESPVATRTVNSPVPQDHMKPNVTVNDLWTDPCMEFPVKTVTGAAEPVGELNKPENFSASPLKVSLEELWADPCIEFAVKTLTGEIPLGDGSSLHRPTNGGNLRVLREPDVK